jgi:hypothetical protein
MEQSAKGVLLCEVDFFMVTKFVAREKFLKHGISLDPVRSKSSHSPKNKIHIRTQLYQYELFLISLSLDFFRVDAVEHIP